MTTPSPFSNLSDVRPGSTPWRPAWETPASLEVGTSSVLCKRWSCFRFRGAKRCGRGTV